MRRFVTISSPPPLPRTWVGRVNTRSASSKVSCAEDHVLRHSISVHSSNAAKFENLKAKRISCTKDIARLKKRILENSPNEDCALTRSELRSDRSGTKKDMEEQPEEHSRLERECLESAMDLCSQIRRAEKRGARLDIRLRYIQKETIENEMVMYRRLYGLHREEAAYNSLHNNKSSVFQALSSATPQLPRKELQVKCSTDTSENHASPMHVRKLEMKTLLNYCRDAGYIETLQASRTTISLESSIQYLKDISTAGASSIIPHMSFLLGAVLDILKDGGIEQVPKTSNHRFGDYTETWGPVDFAIGLEPYVNQFKPWVIGALERPEFHHVDLSDEYCNHDCRDVDCTSQRHSRFSVIRKLYTWMLCNKSLVGIYSNYFDTALFFRDCAGNLLITPSVKCDAVGDIDRNCLSAAQLLALGIMIAKEDRVPEFTNSEGTLLTPCSSECRHEKLPMGCEAENDVYKEINQDTNDDDYVFSLEVPDTEFYGLPPSPDKKIPPRSDWTSLHQLKDDKFLGWFRWEGEPGRISRCKIPHATKGNVDAVLKLLDTFKESYFVDHLRFEAIVYDSLLPLQGKCVPEFLGLGLFQDGFMYGLGLSFAGEHVTDDDLTDKFKEEAVAALKSIHSLGILHGDIDRRNIMCNHEKGKKPMFIGFGEAEFKEDMNPDDFAKWAEWEISYLQKELERKQ